MAATPCARVALLCAVDGGEVERTVAAYTRDTLASMLRLMGAKPRHSLKVAARVFDALDALSRQPHALAPGGNARSLPHRLPRAATRAVVFAGNSARLPRPQFDALVAWALAEFQYAKPDQADDLRLACRIHERRRSVILLLCGTSGTGKSTLAALLAARMGITTVISTDSLRGVMRSMAAESSCPLLFASTYQAGDCLPPLPVDPDVESAAVERKRAVKGYKAQSELVVSHLEHLLADIEARGESAIVEGVHLSLNLVMPLIERHPTALPFLITISNETKHRERFAVRAKYMSLSPEANRYVQYFRQIRMIQDYLVSRATRHLVPRLNNTNVDRSVDVMHATAFGCMRRAELDEAQLAPEGGGRAVLLQDEFARHTSARGAWSSKSMLAVIRSRRERERGAGAASDSSALTGGDSEEERDVDLGAAGLLAPQRAPASSDEEEAAAVDSARTDSDAGFHSEVGSVMDSIASEDEEVETLGRLRNGIRLATLAEACDESPNK